MSGIRYSPSIVTNGLVLHLDAASPKSYLSGNTTWNDLSRNGNNGTLTNGPTFSAANGGSIVFDGANDYIDCSNQTSIQITQGTIMTWIKTSNAGNSYRGIVVKQWNYGLFTKENFLITYDWGTFSDRSTGINIANGVWKHIAMTFTDNTGTPLNNANIYVNGLNVLTTTIKYSNNNINLQIANGGTSEVQYFNGNISHVSIYNRALTAAEISQNFNATKKRFNL